MYPGNFTWDLEPWESLPGFLFLHNLTPEIPQGTYLQAGKTRPAVLPTDHVGQRVMCILLNEAGKLCMDTPQFG